MHHTIGDRFTWAREGMADKLLCKDGLRVSEVTTDPDSSAGRAADSLYKDGLLQNKLVHFIDTRHLFETIRKSIKKDQTLLRQIKAEQKKLLLNFALDVVDRWTAEINQAHAAYAGDADNLKNKLLYAKHAIVKCYMGDHA